MDKQAHRIAARARFTWMADRAFGVDAISAKLPPRRVPVGKGVAPAPARPAAAAQAPRRPSYDPQPTPAAPIRTQAPPRDPDRKPLASVAALVRDNTPHKSPPLTTDQKRVNLQQLDDGKVKTCTKCDLHAGRTQTVFGEGDVDAEVMFIGEGPGENEDLSGRPFVGRAGEKLTDMIKAMGLKREQVYICNIVKCRPPGNRAPLPEETDACCGYLEAQIETIRPRVIVTLGAPATKYILRNDKVTISKVRGVWHGYRGIDVMPTFHPAYMLRSYTPQVRGQVWSDLQQVMKRLNLPVPSPSRG